MLLHSLILILIHNIMLCLMSIHFGMYMHNMHKTGFMIYCVIYRSSFLSCLVLSLCSYKIKHVKLHLE